MMDEIHGTRRKTGLLMQALIMNSAALVIIAYLLLSNLPDCDEMDKYRRQVHKVTSLIWDCLYLTDLQPGFTLAVTGHFKMHHLELV
jgi:hypothetical protein